MHIVLKPFLQHSLRVCIVSHGESWNRDDGCVSVYLVSWLALVSLRRKKTCCVCAASMRSWCRRVWEQTDAAENDTGPRDAEITNWGQAPRNDRAQTTMESTPVRSTRASSGSLSPPTPSPPRISATLPPQAQQARFANKSARAAGLESGSDSSELTDEDEVALRAKHKKKRGRKPRRSAPNNLGNTAAQEQPPPARRPHSRGTSESTVNGAQNGGGSGSGGTSVSGSQTHSNSRSSRRNGGLVPPTMWEWAYKKNKPTANGLGLEIAPRDGSPTRSHSSDPERIKPIDSAQVSLSFGLLQIARSLDGCSSSATEKSTRSHPSQPLVSPPFEDRTNHYLRLSVQASLRPHGLPPMTT